MRNVCLAVLLLVTGGLGAACFYLLQDDSILVRVRGTHVYLRRTPPPSLDEPNVRRYVEAGETFSAIQRVPSKIPGQTDFWYELINTASGEQGWVYGDYLVPLTRAAAIRLRLLGPIKPPESQVPLANNLIGIVAGILTIVSSILTIFVLRLPRAARDEPKPAPGNVVAFPSQQTEERAQVIFGHGRGGPWLFRPKAPRKGGGR